MLTTITFCSKPKITEQNSKSSQSYVFASGGLNVRSEPSADSDILITIPDRTIIEIKNESLVTETQGEIDGVLGNWRQITFQNINGYIFDGFTSSIIPPNEECDNLKEYLDENFKTIRVSKSLSYIGSHYDPNEKIFETRVFYENDLEFFNYNLTEGSMDCIQANNLSLINLFRIGKRCFGIKPNKIKFPFSKSIHFNKKQFLENDIEYKIIPIRYFSNDIETPPWKAVEIHIDNTFYSPENEYVYFWLISEPNKAICLGGSL